MTAEERQEARTRWAQVSTGWEARAEALRQSTMPVSAWMVEAIRPQPGHTVLELAAGPGDTGFLAAELIQPGGTLICSDLVPEMLNVAQRRAETLGITNVRFRQIDAESAIDLPTASLDGVLCRWGYMLMLDSEQALRETRRLLKSGGRVALAAWADPDENLWMEAPWRELARRGLIEEYEPEAPGGPFAWAREGVIADRLEAAGFVEHTVHALRFPIRYADAGDWWERGRDMSKRLTAATDPLDRDTLADLRDSLGRTAERWAQEDGSLAIPACTWVAVATG
jgi:SAM-dependent methyltransferase